MTIGTVRREVLKAGTAIIQDPQHVHARVVQHNAMQLRVGGDSTWTARC
jgi:hypothetical protein